MVLVAVANVSFGCLHWASQQEVIDLLHAEAQLHGARKAVAQAHAVLSTQALCGTVLPPAVWPEAHGLGRRWPPTDIVLMAVVC